MTKTHVERSWPPLTDAPSWRGRSAEDHARALELACRGAMELLASAPDREATLARTVPVPDSTRLLLRRLASGHDA